MDRKRNDPDEHRHPIKVVSRRTGLSPEVLRVWEKRYAVVEPGRTETGRRLYSDREIERLHMLRQATLLGRRIGEIASLDDAALAALVSEDREANAAAPRPTLPDGATDPRAESYLQAALDAVRDLDAAALESILSRSMLSLGSEELIEQLLGPLARRIGEEWEGGGIEPYHEHLASVLVRQSLTALLAGGRSPHGAPTLIVTTPSGQRHEIGAVLAAAAALADGWSVIYLGPELPASDIARAAAQAGAAAVALSLVFPKEAPETDRILRELRHELGADMPLIVGGAAAPSYAATLRRIGARLLPDTRALRALLGELRDGGRGNRPLPGS